jgi:hypothetical protein
VGNGTCRFLQRGMDTLGRVVEVEGRGIAIPEHSKFERDLIIPQLLKELTANIIYHKSNFALS